MTAPLPCQLCKQDARRPAPYTWCETSGCLMYGNTAYTVEKWNALQTALIELQREAFEAAKELDEEDVVGDPDTLPFRYETWADYLVRERSAK